MLHFHMNSLNNYSFILFCSATIATALISSALCFAAEIKKSKKNDLRFNGKLCHLPQSPVFGLGIAALISLTLSQIIGSFFICRKLRSSHNKSAVKRLSYSCILMVFSWVSFAVAAMLIGGATSMSRSQPFGEGWLDGDCYLVKDGVYVGSALFGLAALGSTLGSAAIEMTRRQAEEDTKVHAQDDECVEI
ncbi:protein MODIFYING WALL LIGNIN-1-like [Salvia divinorum]|uniref:Protein MODIFYING WALL LIGNIN-1-like n=1 Tax=Salvia divinorum TaxID=28513 RepID=A0ABD1HKF6_SALDI